MKLQNLKTNPYDLHELGKKYPALKKEHDNLKKQFNELRITCDNALTEKSKAKRQRDKCVEVLKEWRAANTLGDAKLLANARINREIAIKSTEND